MTAIKVTSEIGHLRKLLIHSPDGGIGTIIPSKFRDWLYDDTVHLGKMQKQYDEYLKVLLYFLDPGKMEEINAYEKLHSNRNIFKPDHPEYFASDKVVDVQYRLSVILKDEAIRTKLIAAICALEGCPLSIEKELATLPPPTLAKVLITGVIARRTHKKVNKFIFPPLPNLIFTRDIGITINDHILLSKTSKQARKRESLLAKFIVYYDLLKDDHEKVLEITEDSDFFLEDESIQKEKLISIEGGDIMMIGKHHLLVGCSERTSASAVNAIINTVFSKPAIEIEYVTVIKIEEDRSQMHIDTIFTQISRSEWVIHTSFSEKLKKQKQALHFDRTYSLMHAGTAATDVVKIIQYYKPVSETYDAGKEYLHENKLEGMEDLLASISESEYGIPRNDVKIIYSGNAEFPHDEREQWTDACNLLAIKEGVVIGYARNERTAKAFEEQLNYKVIKSRYLIQQFEEGTLAPADVEKTLILLPSSELSRARGGSHCMSMPLLRDN